MHYSENDEDDWLYISQKNVNSLTSINSSVSAWTERWFWSTNAKDIGTFYLIFALFSGLLGTAFSVLIRMELSGPGVQYIADNQLYNSIITAHAILMSAPICFTKGQLQGVVTELNGRLNEYQTGEIKLHGETQTVKLILKEENGISLQILGLSSDLCCRTFKIMNLTRISSHDRTSAKCRPRTDVLTPSILSLVSMLFKKVNLLPHRENTRYAGNQLQTTPVRNFGITYGKGIKLSPKNIGNYGPLRGGDGTAIVQIGRAVAINLHARTFASKAGGITTTRGSETKELHTQFEKSINIKAISNLKNLTAAYELIKSKPGNMTKGIEPTTLDGISMGYLLRIQKHLKAGTYEFKPARRIQIPKPGKKETRPLTVASPREKIVQKAIQLVMEPTFENIFLEYSHGFRPNKGTRTAIQYLDSQFQSVHCIIEADFSQAFPSIPHEELLKLLREKIKCDKTIKIIRSGLKAGYVEFGRLHEDSVMGTPQGSILSPLLCNIYLHELDVFMETLKEKYNKGDSRKSSTEYMKLQNKAKYWRKRGYDKRNHLEYKKLLRELRNIPSKVRDESYTRIHYVRYADDFIIGVEGSAQQAQRILRETQEFAEKTLKLNFNPEKTGITKYSERPVSFLGYTIMAPHTKGITKALEQIKSGGNTITRRKKIRVRISMDMEKVLKKLQTRGIIRKRVSHTNHKNHEYRGTFMGNLINLDHADIIRYYNSVIRGIHNYYDFVNNRSNLLWIIWLITESCALTLTRKFKMKTLSKTFRTLGPDLGCDIQRKEQKIRVSIIRPKELVIGSLAKQRITNAPTLASLNNLWNAKFSATNLGRACIICGEEREVEMHHVRKIRDLKNNNSNLDFFTRQMAAINRKQIPLCKLHHTGLHNDTWTQEEREKFANGKKAEKTKPTRLIGRRKIQK